MTEIATMRRSTFDHLPRINRAAALLMQEEGLLTIVEDAAEQSFGATEA